MAEYPYLPLFVTDYVAATPHLSDAEHGIYLQLLMLMWQSPDCRIPDDDEWLARRFRRDANAVRTHMRPIISEFCQTHSGWVTQKRLSEEWQWRKAKSKVNSRSAKSRWDKEKGTSERNATTHSERNAPTLPYPTLKKDKKDSPSSPRVDDGQFEKFWNAYPRRTAKKAAKNSFMKAIKEISIEKILSALEQQKKQWADPKFIPHPATWLNQGRWDDEAQKPSSGFVWRSGIEGVV